MIVIVVIPVVIAAPAMAVLIPPAMVQSPAPFPCLVQFMTPTVCLSAVPSMVFHGLVEFVVGPDNAPLAVIAIRLCAGHSSEGK
jgi:hypothetical protein